MFSNTHCRIANYLDSEGHAVRRHGGILKTLSWLPSELYFPIIIAVHFGPLGSRPRHVHCRHRRNAVSEPRRRHPSVARPARSMEQRFGGRSVTCLFSLPPTGLPPEPPSPWIYTEVLHTKEDDSDSGIRFVRTNGRKCRRRPRWHLVPSPSCGTASGPSGTLFACGVP